MPAEWEDTFFLAAGVVYRLNTDTRLRAGISFDENPIPDRNRTPRLPGSDAITLALGSGFRLGDATSIDLALQYSVFEEAPVEQTDPAAGTLDGKFELELLVASVQWSYRF